MKRKKQRDQGVECQLATNTYGYINYLNPEHVGSLDKPPRLQQQNVEHRIYE